MRLKKIIEATDAVAVIHAGDTVASAGYAGSGPALRRKSGP